MQKMITHFSEGKMDYTKLQCSAAYIQITVMGLSFSVKLAFNFKCFERLRYSPLYYAYKTENFNS